MGIGGRKKRFFVPVFIGALVCLVLAGLWYFQYRRDRELRLTLERGSFYSPALFRVDTKNIGCKAMVDNYCASLYAKDARGNLQIEDGKRTRITLQGKTTNNFDGAAFAYYRARANHRSRLPADLRDALARREFYPKLEKLLTRPSKKNMPLDERIFFSDLENEVDRIWENAIEESIARRLEKRYRGTYLEDDEMSLEIELERQRLRYRLWAQISTALWKDHPNWEAVQEDFTKLKVSFTRAIQHLGIPPELKTAWAAKIRAVQLTLPGHSVLTANSACISTSRNAYYYPYLNTLTVCAGYFNGGQQIQTLAHELAHALDFNSRLVDFQQRQPLLGDLREIKDMVCGKKTFNCGEWHDFAAGFGAKTAALATYTPELPAFHSCLQKNRPVRELTDDILQEKAEKISRNRFSDLTKNSAFFRLISEKMPLPSGDSVPNRAFMNPCSYYLWDSEKFQPDSELTSLILFTAAYRCAADSDGTALRTAVETSKKMTQDLIYAVLKSEGVFSDREELQTEAYASPPTERFADRMASYAVADYLRQYPGVAQARSAYLASTFWLCDKPSLRKSNYQQYQSLRDLIVDRTVHLENEERLKDWFSPPLMERLSCQPDFEDLGCSP